MKSQKGISLISLTVYIIGMTIAVAAVTVISSYFYKNVDVTLKDINPLTEYTKFTSFFSDEVNKENMAVNKCGNNYIVFYNINNRDDKVQYSFVEGNKGIYRGNVKICRNVNMCTFEYKESEKKVNVRMQIGNGEYRDMTFKLKN